LRLLVFENNLERPHQALDPQRIGYGELLTNVQVFHRCPPSNHSDGK